jgi:hypothetical protein
MNPSIVRIAAMIGIATLGLSFAAAQRSEQLKVSEWSQARPPAAWTGSYSAVTARELHRITDAAAWTDLWSRHVGDQAERDSYGQPVVPEVNFDHFMVIAIFNGESWNTRSMDIIEQAEIGGELHVRFDAMTYQTMSEPFIDPDPLPAGSTHEEIVKRALERMDEDRARQEANKHNDPNFTRAYGLFIVPRHDGPLMLIENTQGLLGQPPIWTEQQRFEAIRR